MSKTIVRKNESLDDALRLFKRTVSRNGTLQEYRKREYYEKPSEQQAPPETNEWRDPYGGRDRDIQVTHIRVDQHRRHESEHQQDQALQQDLQENRPFRRANRHPQANLRRPLPGAEPEGADNAKQHVAQEE